MSVYSCPFECGFGTDSEDSMGAHLDIGCAAAPEDDNDFIEKVTQEILGRA